MVDFFHLVDLIEGVVQPPQNGEVKALSVSVPPMIFVNAMTP